MTWFTLGLAFIAALGLFVVALRLRKNARERDLLRRHLDGLRHDLDDARLVNARFLGSVTHELRTPLTAILGYQELIADGAYGDLDPRCRGAVMRIGTAAAELLALIDGVLEIARLDSGHLQLRLAPVEADAVVGEAVSRARTLGGARGVSLRFEPDAPLPRLITDPDRLTRTLDLALTSAIHASGAGGSVHVRARRSERGFILDVRGSGNPVPVVGGPGEAAQARDRPRDDSAATAHPASPDSGEAGVHLGLASRFARALGGQLTIAPGAHCLLFHLDIRDTGPLGAPAEARRRASA